MKHPCVYVLASKRNGVVYIGVTGDIHGRMAEHDQELVEGFTVDAASLDLYIAYRHYEVDLALAGELGGGRSDLTAKDFDTVISGARINF